MYCKKAVATSPPFCYALHYKYSTFEEPKQGVSEKLIATFNELCITNEKIGTYPFKTDFNPAERNFVLQFSALAKIERVVCIILNKVRLNYEFY